MNSLKHFFWLFAIAVLTLTSCEDDFIGNFDDDFGFEEPIDDGNHGGNNDDGHTHNEEGGLTLYRVDGSETITKIKDYEVASNLLPFQQDYTKHDQMWAYFKKLIPIENRGEIVEFEVFHGGGELLGYVKPINDNDLSRWKLGLAIDATGDLTSTSITTDFAYTIIHEYGHILTLNHLQVDAATDAGSCSTYHTGEGCSKPNSYINELYNLGWKDIIDEFNAIQTDQQGEDFYNKYQSRFVTNYALSNPGEDVAEVFAVFVTADAAPTGNTIADQKIQAMYNRPELVELRRKIRQDNIVRAIVPGSWKQKKVKFKKLKKPIM